MSTNAPSIGVNLRVTGHCNQGGRKYMEDAFAVAYQQTDDENDLEFAYFGIFDGHGGRDAALFAKEHLMNAIVSQKCFWSDCDENVLKAIKEGFIATHMAMWKEVGKWPQTISGLPSTSGTTASVVFIRNGKLYVGHVGDSAIVLGYKDPETKHYAARSLTSDHKPELPAERKRIEDGGGSVMSKCGVQRVVWNRPRIGHKGPIRRSTHIDQIPFLAVARSLGDLWSYDYLHSQFNVSPEPDVCVVPINCKTDRCIIVATDGVWNMISSINAVRYVEMAEKENEKHFLANDSIPIGSQPLINPSRLLVEKALSLWYLRKKRADNATVLTIMLDPPGPPRSEVLLRKRMLYKLRPREEISAELSCSSEDDLISDCDPSVNCKSHLSTSDLLKPNIITNSLSPQSLTPTTVQPNNNYNRAPLPTISSDYDVYMKGSMCLQNSGDCKLVSEAAGCHNRDEREVMRRLAPTPPVTPEPIQSGGRCGEDNPRFCRTQTVWIKPLHSENFLRVVSHKYNSSPCTHPNISSKSSYIESPAPPSETLQSTSRRERQTSIPSILTQKEGVLMSTKKMSKRKSNPGKRELCFLLAKPYLYRDSRNRHVTRSRVRLRKLKQ